jgi:hypothetical protein
MESRESISEEEVSRLVKEQEETRRATDRSFIYKCIAWIVLILLVSYIASTIAAPRRRPGRSEMTQSISNSKQIYLGLMDFEADFGYFPDDASALSKLSLSTFRGSYSNDYLGQLIEAGYIRDERLFFAHDKRYKKRPDGTISPPSRILEKNECGFSYVMVQENGKRRGLSTSDNGGIPILIAPLLNQWGSCEETSYDWRGIYLRVDGSARSERLNPSDQKIKLGGGKTLLETGPGTVWGTLTPVVLLPER